MPREFGNRIHTSPTQALTLLLSLSPCSTDNTEVCNSASTTPVSATAINTTAMNRGNTSHSVTIAAQMNISTNTVNITSPLSLQHPVTITGPVNINIPATSSMNIAHPVAITTPMNMNMNMNIATPAQHCHETYGHYALPVPSLAIFSLVEPGALTSIFALTAVLLTSEWREQTHRVATLQH